MTQTTLRNFFIIGCNRSGTSLLRTMLNHHSEIAVPLESLFLADYLKVSGKVDIELQKRILLNEPMVKEWGVKLSDEQMEEVRDTHDIVSIVHTKYAYSKHKKLWGNKTPRLTQYVNELKKHVPEAVFIHMVRDPRAVAHSLSTSNIHKSNIYYGAIRWIKYLKSGLAAEKKYGRDVLRVYYEDLVTNPNKELKRVCKLIGVRYEKQMLEFMKTGNIEYRKYHKGAHGNLTAKPMKGRIDAWKHELTEKEIKIIEHICKSTMKETGYKPVYNDTELKKIDVYYYRAQRVWGFSLQFMRYVIYWPSYLIYTLYRKIRFGTLIEEILGINY